MWKTFHRIHTYRFHQICPDSQQHSFIHSLTQFSVLRMYRFILASIRILAYNRIENIKFTDKWGNKQVLLSSVLLLLPLLLIQFYVWQFDMMMCFSVRFVIIFCSFCFVSFQIGSTDDCMCVCNRFSIQITLLTKLLLVVCVRWILYACLYSHAMCTFVCMRTARCMTGVYLNYYKKYK